jgi:3-hydroxybutyryl-CoA dehydrogenase
MRDGEELSQTMQISIIGAGTMGHGLALVFALGGHAVRLTDTDAATLEQAGSLVENALATLREAGEADPSWTSERLASAIRRCGTLAETVEKAELIVEAIVEQPEAKRRLFAELDGLAPTNAILASNTSYLDPFPLIPDGRQSSAVIAHWYTPPYLIDLVDIVGGPGTDPAIVEQMRATIIGLGQVPVVLHRFLPGYIANRVQAAIGLEVNRLLDEGYASPREIDDSIIHGLALRIPILGHLAKADFTGLQLQQHALANRSYEPPLPTKRSATIDRLVTEGRTGVLAGHGYFDWGGRNPADLFRERDRKLLALKKAMREIGTMRGQ